MKAGGWIIEGCCKDTEKGYDVADVKGSERSMVEAKGARANCDGRKNECSSSSQIITHFGKALVQTLKREAFESRNPVCDSPSCRFVY